MPDCIANKGDCCPGSVRSGTYGNAYDVPQITIDRCGRISRIKNVTIAGGSGGGSQWTGTKGDPIYYVPYVGIGSSSTPTSNLRVTGNVYVSNAVTTANVHVSDTLDVTGSMTANAANATFFFDTFTIPYINTQYLNVSANTTLTGNLVVATANIATLNVGYLTVNSAVVYGATTLNVYGTSNLTNVFATTVNVATTSSNTWVAIGKDPPYGLLYLYSNSIQPTINIVSRGGSTVYPQINFQYTNPVTPATYGLGIRHNQNQLEIGTSFGSAGLYASFGSSGGKLWNGSVVYSGALNTSEIMRITGTGVSISTLANARSNVDVAGNIYVSNAVTTTNVFTTNVTATGIQTIAGLAGQTSLNVTGNLYASNAVTTTNVFANTSTLTGTTGQTSLNVTGNAVVSNAVTTTNVFATNGLNVGPGTLGSNVFIFSNVSGGSNVFVMDSNGRITVGSTTQAGGSLLSFGQPTLSNKVITLYDQGSTDNPVSATNFYGLGINGGGIRYQGAISGALHMFYSGTTLGAVITSTGINITQSGAASAPTSNLQVTGNAYVSNALTTTNVFANTSTLTGTTGQTSLNVTGNLYVSNAVTTTNIVTAGFTSNATNTVFNFDTLTIPFINSTTLNVASTSNLDTVTLTGEPGLTTVFASGNAYVSNALTTTNVFAATETLTGTTGRTTSTITGNLYVSNALTTTNVFATTVSAANPIPFRNRIINGGMTVWQRNTASISTTTGIYTTADRWCGALGTSGLILSQWPGPTEAPQFPYSLQVTTSTTTTGVPLVEQHIENLNIPDLLNGTPVTVSFYAGQPYGTLMPLTVGLYYGTVVNNFGTQTLAVAATQNTPTLTTANVYYSLSFTLTSSLGATNGLSLRFTTGGASAVGSTILLTGVQLEKGAIATPFEMRPYATELALCQRYYYQLTSPTAAVQGTSSVYAVFGTATGVTTTAFWVPIQFPVSMRNPYYTFSNSAVSNFQLIPTGTTTITSVGIQSDSYTPVGATLNFVGTNIVAGSSYIFRTNNLTGSTTAFFGFSCEL